MSENLFKLLESFIDNPRPHLMIEINSNLSLPESIINRLVTTIEKIPENNFKGLKIISSIDTGFKEAQYIRNGLKAELLQKNVEKLLVKIPKMELRFTVTYSLFSVFNFSELLSYVLELKREYKTYDKILLSIYPLIAPYNLSLKILDSRFNQLIQSSLDEMNKYRISDTEPFGFNEYEIDSMEKILEFYKDTYPESLKKTLQKDFYIYVKDYDLRKETNILEIFPDYKEFFEKCEKITQEDLESLIHKKDLNYEDCKELIKSYQREAFVSQHQQKKILEQFKAYLVQNPKEKISEPWGLIRSLYREPVKEIFSNLFIDTVLKNYLQMNLEDLPNDNLSMLVAAIDDHSSYMLQKDNNEKVQEYVQMLKGTDYVHALDFLKIADLDLWLNFYDEKVKKEWIFFALKIKTDEFFTAFVEKIGIDFDALKYSFEYYLSHEGREEVILKLIKEHKTEEFELFIKNKEFVASLSMAAMIKYKGFIKSLGL